jgi:hypothetical protein
MFHINAGSMFGDAHVDDEAALATAAPRQLVPRVRKPRLHHARRLEAQHIAIERRIRKLKGRVGCRAVEAKLPSNLFHVLEPLRQRLEERLWHCGGQPRSLTADARQEARSGGRSDGAPGADPRENKT